MIGIRYTAEKLKAQEIYLNSIDKLDDLSRELCEIDDKSYKTFTFECPELNELRNLSNGISSKIIDIEINLHKIHDEEIDTSFLLDNENYDQVMDKIERLYDFKPIIKDIAKEIKDLNNKVIVYEEEDKNNGEIK